MKKLVRSRAGRLSSRPSIRILVSPIEMSKCPASSKTVHRGRLGSTGTSFVGARQPSGDRPAKTCSTRVSSSWRMPMVVS
jgi:hypothetical protein